MKVFLHGKDRIKWSIDSDRKNAERFLRDIGIVITNNFITADFVHSVWWNQLLSLKYYFLRFKKRIIATATNEINPDDKEYLKAKKFISLWIAPNKKQYEVLKKDSVNVVYQPFYVDEKIFKKLNKTRQEISNLLRIDYEILREKFLIGSFQRDTLGSDLISPKWQKNPELLIEILSGLPAKNKLMLVLAGPRRHYVISECEKKGIPYLYIGQKPKQGVDDICINTLDHEKIALLYNLIDCYLITSKSEGGPKAVLEASLCKTLIFSTNVGMAPDILDNECIYNDIDTVRKNISQLIDNKNLFYFQKLVEKNFNKAVTICSYEVMKERWRQIYEQLKSI